MPSDTLAAACPLCGAQGPMEPYFAIGAPRIRHCRDCSLAFVYPRLSGLELESQYSPRYFEEKYDHLRQSEYVNMEAWPKKVSFLLGQVSKFRRGKKGLLLDLGCGKGWFLEAARERGWQVRGLELCPEVAKETEERIGAQIYRGSIFDVGLPEETFDVVTMLDTIEHLETPVEALRICHRILKPGGVLMLTTPNLRGLGCRMLGSRAYAVWPDEHIVYFGPSSIRRALISARFDRVNVSSREVYPENAASMAAAFLQKKERSTDCASVSNPAVVEMKLRVRRSRLLRGLRSAANMFFSIVPLGDDLTAVAFKRY